MRSIIKTLIAATALFGAGALSARAGELDASLYKMMDACHKEYDRYCPNVEPGDGGQLVQCLSTFKSELSVRCGKAFNIASAMRACEADYHSLCQGVPPGRGEAVRCLEENGRDVSKFCRRSIQAVIPDFGYRHTAQGGRGGDYRGEADVYRDAGGYSDDERDRRRDAEDSRGSDDESSLK